MLRMEKDCERMTKMKKGLALILALALCLGLAACGSKPAAEDDWSTIEASGELKIGFTYFEPMNYIDDTGELVGFETEFATAVCEKLGLKPNFKEINWDSKIMELQSQNIDCIWNGMTITSELKEAMSISDPYIKNYQVVVIRAENADTYRSTADLVGKTVEAEAGSAGEGAIAEDENLKQATYIAATKQTETLLEVKAGAADAAVLDFVLADAMVGKGDYADLMVIPDLQLSLEEYGVGCRMDSKLTEKINQAMKELIEDGTLNAIAEKYELADLLLANQGA